MILFLVGGSFVCQVIGWAGQVTGDFLRSVVHLVDCGSSVWLLLLLRGCCCRCSSCCFSCCCCCVHVAPTILIRCVQGGKRKEVWDTTVGYGRKHLKMNTILFSKQPLTVRRSSHRRLSSWRYFASWWQYLASQW